MKKELRIEEIGTLIWDDIGYGHDYFYVQEFDFLGEVSEVEFVFKCYEEENLSTKQILDYCYFVQNIEKIFQNISTALFGYYNEVYEELALIELGFKKIERKSELSNLIDTSMMILIKPEEYNYIGVALDCKWEEEHGIGIKVINGEVVEIGFQDIIL